ncbi:hypothetical protein GBAR_LOCUS16927, partial [Geodia barretti]
MMPVYSVTQILMRFAQFMMMSPVMVLGKTAALYSFRGAACKGTVTVCPTMPERCQPLRRLLRVRSGLRVHSLRE